MSEPTNLREQLFPDGCPDAETFIRVLANYIRSTLPESSEPSEHA